MKVSKLVASLFVLLVLQACGRDDSSTSSSNGTDPSGNSSSQKSGAVNCTVKFEVRLGSMTSKQTLTRGRNTRDEAMAELTKACVELFPDGSVIRTSQDRLNSASRDACTQTITDNKHTCS